MKEKVEINKGGAQIGLEELRRKLNQFTIGTVYNLSERSHLKLNGQVYIPQGIKLFGIGERPLSFLQFQMENLENYFALGGRYEYGDQYPFSDNPPLRSLVKRVGTETNIVNVPIKIGGELMKLYLSVLPQLCDQGEDPRTYEQTVHIDALMLHYMHERINTFGRYIADAKLKAHPELVNYTTKPDEMIKILKDERRKNEVVGFAKQWALNFQVKTEPVVAIINGIIEMTMKVEVAYIQKLDARTNLSNT
ncbi:MAG: hypothetical protein KGH61_00135 [Candidatus Micrarchaeota archaeon]|nr:hypothetical protein [Candidatus Micrarchaeota archaeon]MDE1847345.1 hypothetical protein [Candidatus Micrarchaeota archaeon]MDE1863960.1 hypothetical protein [Candidatus Micrarchaeota archaeon]